MKKRTVILIIVLSFLVKLIWMLKVPLSPVYDFETFYRVAVNLFHGEGFTLDGYPWAFQSYGYPMFLGLFFKLCGNCELITAKVFNLILSTLTLPIVYSIMKKYIPRKGLLTLCFSIFAFLPNCIIYVNVVGSEILSMFLFALIVWMNVYQERWKHTFLMFSLQGLLCGLLSLVKPFFMAYPIALLFIWLVKRFDRKKLLKMAVGVFAGFFLVLACSSVKNYRAFHKFMPISYNGGYVLYINNNSYNEKGGWMDAAMIPASDELKEELREVGYEYDVPHETEKAQMLRNADVSGILSRYATKWILQNPLEFISLGLVRIMNVFFSGANDVSLWGFENLGTLSVSMKRIYKIFMGFANAIIYFVSCSYIVLLFANIKKIFSKKTFFENLLLFWSVAFFFAVFFVFEGQARYNFPVLFLLIICSGMMLEKLADKEKVTKDK